MFEGYTDRARRCTPHGPDIAMVAVALQVAAVQVAAFRAVQIEVGRARAAAAITARRRMPGRTSARRLRGRRSWPIPSGGREASTIAEPAAHGTRYALSADGMTLTIARRAPGGLHVTTVHRQPQAGPFTGAAIAAALGNPPAADRMHPGQRNRTLRTETRSGVVWTRLMLGPPTWWLPRLRRERDGTVMAGWLRAAVAAKLDRQAGGVRR